MSSKMNTPEITITLNMETGAVRYVVPRPAVEVPEQWIRQIVEEDGTAYWARSGRTLGASIVWKVHEAHEYGANGRDRIRYTATFEQIAAAVAQVADGKVECWDSVKDQVREALATGEWLCDTDAHDVILQVALFGKVIYG